MCCSVEKKIVIRIILNDLWFQYDMPLKSKIKANLNLVISLPQTTDVIFSFLVLSRIFFSNLFLFIPTSQLFTQKEILISPIYHVSKIIMTFHCLKHWFSEHQFRLGLQKFFLDSYNICCFFLTKGLNNFWNKVHLLLYRK